MSCHGSARDPAADVVLQKIRGAGEPQAGGVDGEVIGVPMSPLGGTVFVVVGGAALISLADKLQRLVLGQVMGLLDAGHPVCQVPPDEQRDQPGKLPQNVPRAPT